jgi:general secretion pathway protein D
VAASAGGGGGGVGGGGLSSVTRTNNMATVQAMVRQFFLTLGVDLNPPKTVFFNDREGTLLVHASLADLDLIEAGVQVLDIEPPQVNIKTRFVEVAQNDTRALGFDWYFGNFLMNHGSLGLQGGSAPAFNGSPTRANPTGVFPSQALPATANQQLVTSGLRNTVGSGVGSKVIPELATLSGILTDPQFRVVLRALEQRDGADLLNEASVTTVSGRQTSDSGRRPSNHCHRHLPQSDRCWRDRNARGSRRNCRRRHRFNVELPDDHPSFRPDPSTLFLTSPPTGSPSI